MPVTLKLSKRFYDTFGQEVTNELVDTLNVVDQSYRAEFRELFEAHFGRLESRQDRLAVELRGEMAKLGTELRSEMAKLGTELRSDMAQFGTQLRGEMAQLSVGLHGDMQNMDTRWDKRLEALKSELLKWMFLFWVGTMGSVLAILKL